MYVQRKRRGIAALLAALLMAVALIAPVGAGAESKSEVKVMMVTEEGARVRSGPSSEYGVLTSLKDEDRVFYLGKTVDDFAYVRTDHGVVGYIYKGFLQETGSVNTKLVYCTTKSAKVYKRASTHSSKVAKLTEDAHVVVLAVKGKWAYVSTLDGKLGFMKKGVLTKAR